VIEARARTVLALFGDDWIGELSKSELDLLSGPYGPQRKTLANRRSIKILSPCQPNLRAKLDTAIGRAERAYLQEATVIDVLHDNGFPDDAKAFDAGRLQEFLAREKRPDAETYKRGPGKPRDLIEGVKLKMESDLRGGTDLESIKQEALGVKYDVSRNTAVQARREVLEKLAATR
jgi:hypothetical protein